MRYPLGTAVQFRPVRVRAYASIYGVTAASVFHVAHTERRGRRRVLYLWRTVGDWIPSYASHVRKAHRPGRARA